MHRRHSKHDDLRDHRVFAYAVAFWAIVPWPMLVETAGHFWQLSDTRCKDALWYMGTFCLIPVLGWLYAVKRKEKRSEPSV